MEPPFRLDHAVIKVDDLAASSRDFAALGFTLVPGGEHQGRGSHNALIALADGSYIELIAFRERAAGTGAPRGAGGDRTERWRRSPEGLVDFALCPAAIEEALHGARRRGLAIEGPVAGGRRRPDGVELGWQLGLPDGFDLPFLCADLTPRALRVPEGTAREHRNGAAGIRRIAVAVADVAASARRYRALLGTEGAAVFTIGGSSIALRGPSPATGPVQLILTARGGAPAGPLDRERACGARIELIHEG